jgi:transcriptional regulator with XRE-family HTH domain
MSTPLGDKIHLLRKQKGYTLDKLADLTESSKSYIWELENKSPPRPSAEKIARIAAELGVTADYLMDASTPSPNTDVIDEAFFRGYKQLDTTTKEKIRSLVEIWRKEK